MEKIKSFLIEYKSEAVFFLSLFVLLFLGIGRLPFLDPDSYQWLEKSFEITRHNNWLTHSQWFGKPPLIIWITAFAVKIFGYSLFSLKVMNLLISWFSVLFVYLLAKEMFGRKIAFWTSIIYTVSPTFLFLKFSHKMDVAVALFMASAFYFFYVFRRTGKPINIYLFWASCFAGFFSKSGYSFYPVILIPLVAFLTKDKEIFEKLKNTILHQVAAVSIMMLILAPWYIGQYLTHGRKFLEYQYIEQLGRLLFKGGDFGNRDNSFLAYPVETFVSLLPWSIFIVPAIMSLWKKAKNNFNVQLLFWWFIPVMVVFSLSGDLKTARYMMFSFPPIAMIIANYLESMSITKKLKIWVISAASILLVSALSLIIVGINSSDAFVRDIVPLLGSFLAVFFIGIFVFSILFWLKEAKALKFLTASTAASLILLMLLSFFMLGPLYPRLNSCSEISDKVLLKQPIIIMDMKFRDYAYMTKKIVIIEDLGIENVKKGDYIASSKEFSDIEKKLGKNIDIIYAKDAKYKSGRKNIPYRLFRVD